MTSDRNRQAGSTVAVLSMIVLAGACSSHGARLTDAPSPVVAASVVASPTMIPAGSLPAATAAAPTTVASTAVASQLASTPAEPPTASLSVEGGDVTIGQLGSYTWDGAGSDSPWLPGAPITVGAGERLRLDLAPSATIVDWMARAATVGTLDGVGAMTLGTGPAPIEFPAPGAGRWSVQVNVQFTGGIGSASYYWLVTVR